MTTILPERASLLGGVQHSLRAQIAINAAVVEAEAKIEDAAFEFATGALGTQLAVERSMFGGIGVYMLKNGDEIAGKQLSAAQARGLRDYLNSLDLG